MAERRPSAEDRIKENIVYLCDLLLDICADAHALGYIDINPSLIKLACDYVKSYNAVNLTEDFIFRSVRYWPQIKEREVSFFENNISSIFGALPFSSDQLNMFKIIYHATDADGQRFISEDDVGLVWEYLFACCRIAINYMIDNPESYSMIKVKLANSKNPYTLDLDELSKVWCSS